MDKIKAWQIFRTIPGFINKNSDFFAILRSIHLVVTWTDLSSFFWEYRTPISFYRIRTTPCRIFTVQSYLIPKKYPCLPAFHN